MNATVSFFVYGTLKRGECRAALWPCRPTTVIKAFTRGQLYDLGPYPALLPGDDWVCGECWRFPAVSLDPIRCRLDEIEVFQQPNEPDLYCRSMVDVFPTPDSPASITAETYHYVDQSELTSDRYIAPLERELAGIPYAIWPP